MSDLRGIIRLVENQQDYVRSVRDRYQRMRGDRENPMWSYHDGRFQALRDLALQLKETGGDMLPPEARERSGFDTYTVPTTTKARP